MLREESSAAATCSNAATLEQERYAITVAGVAAKLVENEEGSAKVYLVLPVVFCVTFALVKTGRCWV